MKILISIFGLICILSCKKQCDVPTQIIGSGEILNNANVTFHPDTASKTITWELRREHIIQSDTQNIYNLVVSFNNENIENIDFKKYTVLGKYTTGQCKVTFERNVTKNDLIKQIEYKIKVHQCGNCKENLEDMNWVLVPKIPDSYKIIFIVE